MQHIFIKRRSRFKQLLKKAEALAENCGLLPFRIYSGKVQFLLGQESSGSHPFTWCDFGGGVEDSDASNLEAACREGHEETRGVIGSRRELEAWVDKEDYLDLKYTKKGQPESFSYRMYLLYLDEEKASAASKIVENFSLISNSDVLDNEKCAFAWVESDKVLESINQHDWKNPLQAPKIVIGSRSETLRRPFAKTLRFNQKKLQVILSKYIH